jgi:hypothetical protein
MQTDMAVNNMSQGLLMFDSQSRLVLCNDRHIEMYNLPADVVKPGCTLRELVDHRKEVGSFSGDPEQYCRGVLEEVAKGTTWSRTNELSGGRTIHVVNRPLPGGGWVATHEDVTERKQAQARIEYPLRSPDRFPNRAAFNEFPASDRTRRRAGRKDRGCLHRSRPLQGTQRRIRPCDRRWFAARAFRTIEGRGGGRVPGAVGGR